MRLSASQSANLVSQSAVPACTVLFQYLKGDRLDSLTYVSLVPIVGGVMLATVTEVNFNPIGFWTAVVASFVTAGMAIVSGMLLTTKLNPGKQNIPLTRYISYLLSLQSHCCTIWHQRLL